MFVLITLEGSGWRRLVGFSEDQQSLMTDDWFIFWLNVTSRVFVYSSIQQLAYINLLDTRANGNVMGAREFQTINPSKRDI